MRDIDFDAISAKLAEFLLSMHPDDAPAIKESLRQVWNCRGDFDAGIVEVTLSALMGKRKAAPYVEHLQRDIGKLDR